MHKIGLITLGLSLAHLLEDAALVIIGRYTEVAIWMVLVGTLLFSFAVSVVARTKRLRKFLG